MSDIVAILRDFGFPVFVAAFLLLRLEQTIRRLEITCAKILVFLQNHTP